MRRVLVAEDDQDIARLITLQLRHQGYQVRLAEDGAQALSLARNERPDVILLDWMMPVMDGLETMTVLKADPDLSQIPVIMMTAKARNQDIQTGLSAGAAAYLVKPFPLEELSSAIQDVLRVTFRE